MVILYVRGARGLVGRVRGFPSWRPKCFFAGVLVLFLALASPIDSLGHLLLWVHMVQHWLLIMVVAPLLLLGAPGVPILRGIPRVVRRNALGPFLASPFLRRCFNLLLTPFTGWIAFALINWTWHTPYFYGAALESSLIHRIEHTSFLVGAILFWWQIVQPWPWRARWSDAALVVYLLTADVQNTIFSAIMTFADRVWYPNYDATAPALGFDALRDQQVAGAFMWTAGQIVMLPAAVFLILRALSIVPRPSQGERLPHTPAQHSIGTRQRHFDLLRLRGVGAVLRSRRARTTIRWTLVVAALMICVDGFLGPSEGPSNLAGTLPWTHWRGVIVIALLCGGNFLCMTCPLMAPRNLLRRWVRPQLRWPSQLRSKWIAVALVATWLVCYEAFDLWASPWATAMIIVGYFAGILVIDGLFRGGSFCKWVCPIGQFHMTQSLVAPLSVSVINPITCATCEGHECIRGSPAGAAKSQSVPLRIAIPGCELELFQPAKRGNLDCTFCLDCVDACPHNNVGILSSSLASSLASPARGSSIGRIASRVDVAALLGLLTFGAFANAAGMTAPWIEWVAGVAAHASAFSTALSPTLVEAAITLVTIVVIPASILSVAAFVSSRSAAQTWRETLARGGHALVPIGAAMWCIHWFFHLATSASTGVPVVQRVLNDIGIGWFGEPQWAASCCGEIPQWLQPLELLLLQIGLLVSGWMAWRGVGAAARRPIAASLPWWLVAILLWLIGCWIIMQPMQMRGTASL